MADNEIKRTCKDCGREFVLAHGEIVFYHENKLDLPARCKACRNKNKFFGGSIQDIMRNDNAPPANFKRLDSVVRYKWHDLVAANGVKSYRDGDGVETLGVETLERTHRVFERYRERQEQPKEAECVSSKTIITDNSDFLKSCSSCWVRVAGGCDGSDRTCKDYFEYKKW